MLDLKLEKHGRVVLFAGEDPNDALHHRLHKMGAHLSPAQRQCVSEKLRIVSCVGNGVDLHDPEWFARIEEQAQGSRLMVIDTLTRFHSLDENNASDAKKIMSSLESIASKTGCSILFLHHVNKSSAMGGTTDMQQAARGSSVFVDNARWLAFVAAMSKEEAALYNIREEDRKMYLRWNISKQNYSAPRPDQWLRRCEGGMLRAVNLVEHPQSTRRPYA
jgi:RecA-family ATPase